MANYLTIEVCNRIHVCKLSKTQDYVFEFIAPVQQYSTDLPILKVRKDILISDSDNNSEEISLPYFYISELEGDEKKKGE